MTFITARRITLLSISVLSWSDAFQVVKTFSTRQETQQIKLAFSTESPAEGPKIFTTAGEATALLADWDRHYNSDREDRDESLPEEIRLLRPMLPDAVRFLNRIATDERSRDSTQGRCILGICASSAEEGIQILKSWVSGLDLPRGLLHGMDKDGVPIQIDGGVYFKYNTGGSLTFAEMRRSKMGFDAIWKPGDVLVEPYDGLYRGVYFQVELQDGEFRQFMVPSDIFDDDSN